MEIIKKTIKRNINDRTRLVSWSDSSVWLLIFLFLVILGIETYYRNVLYADTDNIYIAGAWTWIAGIFLGVRIYKRIKISEKFKYWISVRNNELEEKLSVSDKHIEYGIENYCSTILYWSALESFKNRKTSIEINASGLQLFVWKAELLEDEVKAILELLKEKQTEKINSAKSG